MKRRNFVALAAIAAVVQSFAGNRNTDTTKGFVVRKGKARHDKHMLFKGVNVNDLKVKESPQCPVMARNRMGMQLYRLPTPFQGLQRIYWNDAK